MPLVKGKQIGTGADGIATANLTDDALSADAAGRGKLASGFFDNATATDKFSTGALSLDRLNQSGAADGETLSWNDTAGEWEPVAGGGAPVSSVWLGGDYTYTQAAIPVEEVIGGNSLDGSLVTTTAYFKAVVTNVFSTTGITRIRLYDMGTPSTPGSSRLVCELTFSSNSGPRSVEEALTVVSSGVASDDNKILDSERVYEAVVIQDASTVGDVAYVRSTSLEVR